VLYRSSPDLIGSAVRALAWSPDGSVLVCGCGGDPDKSSKDGAVVVVEVTAASGQLEVRHEDRKAKRAITDVKFAPSGGCFAVASEDGRVYIHDASDYALRTVCSKLPTAVKTLDWSLDSKYLCGVTKGLDLVYLDAASGKPLTTPAIVRDASWATATVPVGFHVQGLWPQDTSVDIQTVDRSASEKLIAKVTPFHRLNSSFLPCAL
jgi:microtubule-associated protein-like 6